MTPAQLALNEWLQVEAWAGLAPRPTRARLDRPGWRAFADLMPTKGLQEPFRCYAHPHDTRIKVMRPCYFAPKKWRSWRVSQRRVCPQDVPPAVWAMVLVALDAWLQGGCRVLQRPPVIPISSEAAP